MAMTSGTAVPVGPSWGIAWLLQGGLARVQTGRGSGPGVRVGQPLWGLEETGEGRTGEAFARPQELVWGKEAAALQL